MEKRGDLLSPAFIITLVLLLIGAGILFFFLREIKIGQTEDEICEYSVLLRASSPETINTYLPLRCTTKKTCLTSEKNGKCNEFISEKNTETIELPKSSAEATKKIEETLANSMYDCWKTMGEGKLFLFTGGVQKALGFKPEEVSCIICSRIALDISQEKKSEINPNLDEYLRTKKVPNSALTYLETFTDGNANSYSETKKIEKQDKIITFETKKDELAVVFAQIKQDDYPKIFSRLVAVGGTAALTTLTVPVVNRLVISGPGLILAGIGAGGIALFALSNVYEGKAASVSYCGQFSSAEEAQRGCSTVQILPYDTKVINEICKGGIDGNP